MATSGIKSFRLARTTCPQCDSQRTRIDGNALSNVLRVPLAIITGLMIYPANGIRMSCKDCGCKFLTTRNGLEAAKR